MEPKWQGQGVQGEAHSHRVDARIRQHFADHMVGARSQLRVAARAGGELAPMASLFAGTCEATAAVLLTGYRRGAGKLPTARAHAGQQRQQRTNVRAHSVCKTPTMPFARFRSAWSGV